MSTAPVQKLGPISAPVSSVFGPADYKWKIPNVKH